MSDIFIEYPTFSLSYTRAGIRLLTRNVAQFVEAVILQRVPVNQTDVGVDGSTLQGQYVRVGLVQTAVVIQM